MSGPYGNRGSSESRESWPVQGVDISALVMNSDGLSKTKVTNEELIAQRIAKRAIQKVEAQAKAERHKRMVTL